MAPLTQAAVVLMGAAMVKLASGASLLAFPADGCNTAGYYDTISADTSSCSKTYLSDSDYNHTANNDQEYQVWYQLQDELDQGCAFVISRDSTDADSPPCGECVLLVHTDGVCVGADLPTPYYAWECCGSDCNTQCGGIPGKRSIGEAVEELEAREAKAAAAKPDIANLKNRSPAAPKKKRADCSFASTADLFSQAGNPVSVSDTYQPCSSDQGCSEMYSGMVESSFSQTFMVSESTEAGLFDIVSETVTFGYSATWEQSTSESVSGTYEFNEGQSGYITFSPLSQCATGTFSGADCDGMGIPTGGDPRNACVPEKIQGGQIKGDINVVTTA